VVKEALVLERTKDVLAIGGSAAAGLSTWIGVLNDGLATLSLLLAIVLAWVQLRVWLARLRSVTQKED